MTAAKALTSLSITLLATLLAWVISTLEPFSRLEFAQENPSPAKEIVVDVDLVNVPFSAVDKKGEPVKDLRQEEIKVFEKGDLQRITNFSHDPEAPLAIAILIDTSTSSRAKFKVEQEAAIDFVQTAVRRKKDHCLLMSFDSTIDLLQPFTDDPDLLTRAIKRLKTGGGTKMYDAIQKTCQDQLAKERDRRRVIVLISDGDDNMSYETMESALQIILQTDVSVFSISTNSSGFFGMENPRLDKAFKRFSDESGGRTFFPKKIEDMAYSFRDIINELRNTYSLAYRSPNKDRDGAFRSIKVECTRKDVRLLYRKGYYASQG
ncbi:MAG: VWA domain-containing protein [Terriglobia bacterium]